MRLKLVVALGLGLWGPRGWSDEGCQIIVHASNPVKAIEREKLLRIFLKMQTRWDSGEPVLPVDQADGPARAAFFRQVLDKSPGGVKHYWEQRIFSGTDVPPPQRASDAEVIEFVKARPGAVGYVSNATGADGVKVVEVKGAKP